MEQQFDPEVRVPVMLNIEQNMSGFAIHRRAAVYVPPDWIQFTRQLDPIRGGPIRVIFIFHGGGGTLQFVLNTKFDCLLSPGALNADDPAAPQANDAIRPVSGRFILVSPEGVSAYSEVAGLGFSPSCIWNAKYTEAQVRDVDFIRLILQQLEQMLQSAFLRMLGYAADGFLLDPSVVCVGFSNGGNMSARLVEALPLVADAYGRFWHVGDLVHCTSFAAGANAGGDHIPFPPSLYANVPNVGAVAYPIRALDLAGMLDDGALPCGEPPFDADTVTAREAHEIMLEVGGAAFWGQGTPRFNKKQSEVNNEINVGHLPFWGVDLKLRLLSVQMIWSGALWGDTWDPATWADTFTWFDGKMPFEWVKRVTDADRATHEFVGTDADAVEIWVTNRTAPPVTPLESDPTRVQVGIPFEYEFDGSLLICLVFHALGHGFHSPPPAADSPDPAETFDFCLLSSAFIRSPASLLAKFDANAVNAYVATTDRLR